MKSPFANSSLRNRLTVGVLILSAFGFAGAGIVETYISYLRKKIDIYEPPLIHTVRGVGYRLRVPSEK